MSGIFDAQLTRNFLAFFLHSRRANGPSFLHGGIRSWPSLVVQTYSFHPVKSNDSSWISSRRWRVEEGNGCLFSNSTIFNHFNNVVHSKWIFWWVSETRGSSLRIHLYTNRSIIHSYGNCAGSICYSQTSYFGFLPLQTSILIKI